MTDYYISPTGNDTTGNGSSSTPWLTLDKAITASAAGDTIILKDGTYSVTNSTVYRMNAQRIIKAANNGLAILDGGGADISSIGLGTAGLTTTITGLVFKGIHSADAGALPVYDVSGRDASIIVINNCLFYDMECAQSTYVGGFIGSANASASPSGMSLTFNNCLFYDITWNTLTFAPGIVSIRENVTGCTITFNNCVIALLTSPAIGAIVKIANGPSAVATINIKNTIMYSTVGGTILELGSSGGTVNADYNCLDGFTLGNYSVGANDIQTDPLFVDATGGNFNLRPTSPCIGAGVLV